MELESVIFVGLASSSSSHSKIKAVREAFARLGFKDVSVQAEENILSGVSNQPISREETQTGATNRVRHMRSLYPAVDCIVAIESGIKEENGQTIEFSCVAVERDGVLKTSFSGEMVLPPAVVSYMREHNVELGIATDKVFNLQNSKNGKSISSEITKNAVHRHHVLWPAICFAYAQATSVWFK